MVLMSVFERSHGSRSPATCWKCMKLTPQAKKLWDDIAGSQRVRILNRVWCVSCMKVTGMGEVRGNVEKGMLSLKGVCTRCGGLVATIVESPPHD